MTSEWPQRLEIARWEIHRFVQPKQLIYSLVVTAGMYGLGYGVAWLTQRDDHRVAQVAVIGGAAVGLKASADTVGEIAFVSADARSPDSLQAQLSRRAIDGILTLRGPDSAVLVVRRVPTWQGSLVARLTAARQQVKLAQSGMTAQQLAVIVSPVRVRVDFQKGSGGVGALLAALASIFIIAYMMMMATALVVSSVSTEKRLRVTEQMVSAISPQAWMDGKILGLAGALGVMLLQLAIYALVFQRGRTMATPLSVPIGATEPGTLLLTIFFALLGAVFWLIAFGAIAATMDDIRSPRAQLLLLAPLVSLLSGLVIRAPDSLIAHVLSFLPITAAGTIPIRLAVSEVSPWELVLAAGALAASIWFMRLAAGRVFALGMLMYGKEPTWREVRRWARET